MPAVEFLMLGFFVCSAAALASACAAAGRDGDAQTIARRELVDRWIVGKGIRSPAVVRAMTSVPRHLFVPQSQLPFAYENRPLPIGRGQTISQPYVVALMTEALKLEGHERVLEIGTGCGYQAAVLAEIVKEVYTLEVISVLAGRARALLGELGYENVHARHGDGYLGWPEAAPFDAIIATAAPVFVPQALEEQLATGGRLILPVGSAYQDLILVEKQESGCVRRRVAAVAFVPMTHGTR